MKIDDYPVRKKKIFLAACKLFSQKCYADVGIRELAVEAEIQVPTIYSYYQSKEAVLDDLFRYYAFRLCQLYDRVENIDYDQDPVVCLKKMIFTFEADEVGLMRQLMQIVFNEQHRSSHAAKIIFDISLRKAKKGYYDFFAHLKEKGVLRCGEIDSYAEVFSRIGITFAMQFARDDEIGRCPDYETVVTDMFQLMLSSPASDDREEAFPEFAGMHMPW